MNDITTKARIIATVRGQDAPRELSYQDIADKLETTIEYVGEVVREAGLVELVDRNPSYDFVWDEDMYEFGVEIEDEMQDAESEYLTDDWSAQDDFKATLFPHAPKRSFALHPDGKGNWQDYVVPADYLEVGDIFETQNGLTIIVTSKENENSTVVIEGPVAGKQGGLVHDAFNDTPSDLDGTESFILFFGADEYVYIVEPKSEIRYK